jgi:XTP/dITP diphosphohydrolase
MVLMRHANDPTPLICQGTWEGEIIDTPQGDNGFGYDPIFYVAADNCTSAQLAPDKKNALSHRGKALQCLLDKLGRSTFN